MIGQRVKRLEDFRFVTGGGRYVEDIRLEGMLTAVFLRSPHAHARIRAIDASGLDGMPRVVGCYTARDLVATAPPIPIRMGATPALAPYLQPPLAHDHVRYAGEPFAVVVAADAYVARDAAERVAVDYEVLAPLVDAAEAARQESRTLYAQGDVAQAWVASFGDVEAAVRGARHVLRRRFAIQRHTAVPMETRGLVARHDTASGVLTVWGPTKVPYFNRKLLAAMVDLPEDRIHFVEPDVGGAFGVRGEFYPEDLVVPLLAMRLGRPVRWIEERREHLMTINHSREQQWDVTLAADDRGRLLAMDASLVNDMGAYIRTHGTLVPRVSAANLVGPYVVPAYRCRVACVMTTKTPTGTMRAPGHYEAAFVRERALDMLAGEVGITPTTLRERNFVRAEQLPFETRTEVNAAPIVYDTGDFPAVFARALARSGYAELARESAAHNGCAPDVRLGVGVACVAEPSGIGPMESARVWLRPDGGIEIHTGATSQGQGQETTLAQVCAAVLDVPLDGIVVRHGDTVLMPRGEGTYASRAAVMAGSAVHEASRTLRTEILRVGAEILEASPDDLRLEDGRVAVAGLPSRSLSLAEIASHGTRASGERAGLTAYHEHETRVKTTSFSVHVAQVAVDVRTGTVRPRRYVIVSDIGRAINPLIVEGQLAGGVVHGLGGALGEELVYDESGQLLTATLMDYALPAAADCPPIEVEVLELSPSPSNPLGVKGAGEAGTAGAGAVLANAVAAALAPGVEVTALPLTAGRLFRLIQKAFA